jgi:hypothetical protein
MAGTKQGNADETLSRHRVRLGFPRSNVQERIVLLESPTAKTIRPRLMARPAVSPLAPAAIAIVLLTAAGCATAPGEAPRSSVSAPAAFARERLVGRWGIASYHAGKDKPRTEREAKAQCSLPYTIAKGPTDGVMMHVADDPKLYELKLKGDTSGRTYLGFEAPAGDPQDREVLSSTDSLMIMHFVDPNAHRRYGAFVYVRCGA